MNECEKCGKEFKYNYLLIKHLNKKYSCEKVEKINNNYDDKIKKTNEYIIKLTNESINLGSI
jgi:hypothetical protein